MPTAVQILRGAVPNYQYQLPAIQDMIALGTNALIVIGNEGSQLVINDRLRPDRYIVKQITGLRAPDLRDTRAPRPSGHGEVPYDAFWSGKAAWDLTPIPTPDGWRPLKQICVGDRVFDDRGAPCNVLGVYPQPDGRPCYEVVFSDGEVIVADGDHLWETVDLKSRRRYQSAKKLLRNTHGGRREKSSSSYRGVRRDGEQWIAYHGGQFRRDLGVFDDELEAAQVASEYRVQRLRESGCAHKSDIYTTEEILRTLRTRNGSANHAIRVAGALQYHEKELPLKPYALGVWLGDGDSRHPNVYSADSEIIDNLRDEGYVLEKTSRPFQYVFRPHVRYKNGVGAVLGKLGVRCNKHIPLEYLQASIEQRRDLLAGLLDTDGTVGQRGHVEFDSTNKRLADDVLELVRSLGYRPSMTSKRATLDGKDCGPAYRIRFIADDDVFRLSRKSEVLRQRRSRIRYPEDVQYRYIVDVRPVSSLPVRCISVDSSSHLYLAGRSMIPTHNTITFQGTMEAGSVGEINRMESDLLAVLGVFAPPPAPGLIFQAGVLPEYPFKFNWWDVHDAFFDAQTSQAFWAVLTGAALTFTGNGRCTTAGGAASLAYYGLRSGYVDEVVSAEVAVTPGVAGTQAIGVIACCTSDTSYLKAEINSSAGTWTLTIKAVQSSGTTTLASTALPSITQQTNWWIQLWTVDDVITAYVYAVDPVKNSSATPVATATATLMGAMANALGANQTGFVGLTTTATIPWYFLDWRVDSLWPCDFRIMARAVQAPQTVHAKQQITQVDRFVRDFQFAVRASDPRILCPTQIQKPLQVVTALSVALGRIYTRTYPLAYLTPLSEPSGQILSQISGVGVAPQETAVINHGTWIAKPTIVFSGGITNPILINRTTGQSLILDGTISPTDSVTADCLNQTLINAAGGSVMGMFDPAGFWTTLVPSTNILTYTGSNSIGSPTATIYFSHAWI